MKKAVATTFAVFAGMIATTAHAQSSVTLFGTLDTGLDFVTNQKGPTGAGHNNWMMESGNVYTDRWGLRGSEDLGGGLKAVFWLENGFNVDTGKLNNGGDLWGRQAWVGLSSDSYGKVTMGRQYDDLVDFVAPLSATGSGFGGNIAEHPFDNDNLNNDVRMDNSIKFRSVDYNGFEFGGGYGFSGAAGEFSSNNAWTLGASYAHGPVQLAVAYFDSTNPGGVGTPANTTGSLSSSDSNAVLVGSKEQILGAAARYLFGNGQVAFVFTRSVLDNPDEIVQGGSYASLKGNQLTFNNYELNARYSLTPALSLGGSYTYTDGSFGTASGSASPKWNQVMLQLNYAASRRTNLYLEGVYQKVSDANGIPVLGNASIYQLTPSGNDHQAVIAAGILHRF